MQACAGPKYDVVDCKEGDGIVLPTDQIPTLGSPHSRVSITVFGDVTCPITKQLIVELDDYIHNADRAPLELFYRHLLRSDSAPSTDTAAALGAANLQGNDSFWKLYWRLMVLKDLSIESILAAGEASVPDPSAFREQVTSRAVENVVQRDIALGRDLGFTGVPGVILCGQKTTGTPQDIVENIKYLNSKER